MTTPPCHRTTVFVVLTIPAFAFSILKMLGRDGEPVAIDWPGRSAGVLIALVTGATMLTRLDDRLWLAYLIPIPALIWWYSAYRRTAPVEPDTAPTRA